MAENTSEEPGSSFGELRKRYEPFREQAQKGLREAGIKTGKRFRRARAKVGRELFMSGIDEVTGLPVRRVFEVRLQEELNRSERFGMPLTMALVDLNGLKEINRRGYPEGDKALRDIAIRLRKSVRKTDYTARYGGDEYAILFPGVTKIDLDAWWTRFTESMKDIPYSVTTSVMQIDKNNIEEARTKLTNAIMETKKTTNHAGNHFVKAK